jgi:hypothetical protein
MAVTPDEAAAGKIESMLKKLEDIVIYVDEQLVKQYYPGESVTIDVAGFPHSMNGKLRKLVFDKYEAAGWQIKSSSHMNEEYYVFSERRRNGPGTMRC